MLKHHTKKRKPLKMPLVTKSQYVLWLGALIAVVGLCLTLLLKHTKLFYAMIIAGILIQGYAIYLVNRE